MSFESDLLIDRRRLKRRLFFWRTLAVLAAFGCALLLLGPRLDRVGGPHLARLSVTGLITENRKLTEAVSALAKDDSVRGLIVFVDSPGGSVAGGESLYGAIGRVAEQKPVVAVMGGTAASAGYMVSLPAARIFAREATLTGSIGVLLETGEISGLLSRVGITADVITSGPLKGEPAFVRPLSPAGRDVLKGLVMDMYEQFVAMVATRRHMAPEKVRDVADGRAYTGRQALALGLVDAIGGEPEARSWLAEAKGIPETLPVRDVRVGGLAERALADGLSTVLGDTLKSVLSQGLMLDEVRALWQPSRL
ncbi:Signal peptide peptidase SppA [Rhodovastum atsumiense]|uniref:Signal peptide peptidase SppA n=1 Tax=Rhodovastum atsumiense TaxID=504468 RepID=A0A5M6IQH5_9PROT|nr:signal peptide peptidase SppA [Rhodovastum atsumiense]KAA5610471.1 signal peptide peptidase SppA [Rhodovastum atsumiense]CAH2600456.1 Signal peptide peptidase SppA [Rhodovastum atsumiense]